MSRLDDLRALRRRLDAEIERECLRQQRRVRLDALVRSGAPTEPSLAAQEKAQQTDAAVIRAWAVSKGYEMSKTGRVRADIRYAYAAALERGEIDQAVAP